MFVEFYVNGRKKIVVDVDEIESVKDLDNYGGRSEQTMIRTKSGQSFTVMDSYSEVVKCLSKGE